MPVSTMIFVAFAAFFIKHFVVDFLLQPPWMFLHKHEFLHIGGIAHAAFHGVVSAAILWGFYYFGVVGPHTFGRLATVLAVSEFSAHYFIDYAKMNLNRYYGWGANTHQQFWYLLGFDQLLHNLTYMVLLLIWFA